MTVKSAQVWSGVFVALDATGALSTPSVGPAGVLYVDGTANGATVTVSGSNPYKWVVALPTLIAEQTVSMYITATISGVATASVVAEDVADTKLVSDLNDAAEPPSAAAVASATLAAMNADPPAVDVQEVDGSSVAATGLSMIGVEYEDSELVNANVLAWRGATTAHVTSSAGGGLVKIDATGLALEATAQAILEDTGTTLPGLFTASGATVTVVSALVGTALTILRGDTLSVSFANLGSVSGYANIWFTVKRDRETIDSTALVQIDTDTGLMYVNGTAATANQGSITVDDAPTGDLTIAINASVTAVLPVGTGYYYDIQWQAAGGAIATLTSGVATVTADVTRAVA